MQRWNVLDQARKDRNCERTEAYKQELDAWEIERELAKVEHRKPRWRKPVKPKAEKAAPKPVLTLPRGPNYEGESGSDSDSEDNDNDL
ncbi:hypothetical protein FRC08_000110 [Ceratobasidium sp. 394]|nr:hypothetical protein FRC08_000110 [Ceratobasidium sp. 394]KAG9094178.1 hypothetical protein FS749_012989 [Ceratobasidium sp. UAMH 11750]